MKTPKYHETELRIEGENEHVKQKKKHPNIILCYSRGKEADPPKDDSVKVSKTRNMGAYLRKMAIDGYIINTDTAPIKQVYEEMHKIGVNINQIAKKVNTTGDLYLEEMEELKRMVNEIWHILKSSPLK